MKKEADKEFIEQWEKVFMAKLRSSDLGTDPAHDLNHFSRVAWLAKKICFEEKGKLEVVLPAAWLHDLVNISKDDPKRAQASQLSADAAILFLSESKYPSHYYPEIRHAIEAHSFSAKKDAKTLEAKIVQDADRLDSLGAIGIARCFTVGGLLKRPLYDARDPFGEERPLEDKTYTLDHFYVKLLRISQTLHTEAGQKEGANRSKMIHIFLDQLRVELDSRL